MRTAGEISVFEDNGAAAEFAILKWKEIADRAIQNSGRFTVALSGGKTPILFYNKLAERKKELWWDLTHIFMVDERFVPHENADSNYKLIMENLITPLGSGDGNFHIIPVTEKTTGICAHKYENMIKKFFNLKEGEFPKFDLVMLGIGIDGHTASLFPGITYSANKSVIAVSDKSAKHERISITMPVINNADNGIFLVSGKGKERIVKEVIKRQNQKYPAARVRPKSGNLYFILDI